ncbi:MULTISPECIES: hypothetical protein [Ramlibacter]|uniref:HPF/RaiA family ribosome-associated protein n=1 Tax=Ramlibacter aquaticus TaxID=2780094 RepID=A0ABR9SGW3_9BURK|nr:MULTISPECIES: hypothetical protein [Ramlibacter]MBE7941510.1 hypothetical protein [Ramlibacter aquaticus]
MDIDIRSPGVRMPRAQRNALLRDVRHTFASCSHRVAHVLLQITLVQDARRSGLRDCVVEVHLADGHVERVQERRRHVGVVLRRALQRAWQATLRWVGRLVQGRSALRLPAPGSRALPPAAAAARPAVAPAATRTVDP